MDPLKAGLLALYEDITTCERLVYERRVTLFCFLREKRHGVSQAIWSWWTAILGAYAYREACTY